MKVRDVASSAVVAVGPAQSLREATQLMAKHRVGSAVVQAVSVEQIMTADVVTVGPDWDLVEAAKVMAKRRIRHLVVYEGGQLLGVLSVRDVLPAVLPE
jgi:CBS domain-containing protein